MTSDTGVLRSRPLGPIACAGKRQLAEYGDEQLGFLVDSCAAAASYRSGRRNGFGEWSRMQQMVAPPDPVGHPRKNRWAGPKECPPEWWDLSEAPDLR